MKRTEQWDDSETNRIVEDVSSKVSKKVFQKVSETVVVEMKEQVIYARAAQRGINRKKVDSIAVYPEEGGDSAALMAEIKQKVDPIKAGVIVKNIKTVKKEGSSLA